MISLLLAHRVEHSVIWYVWQQPLSKLVHAAVKAVKTDSDCVKLKQWFSSCCILGVITYVNLDFFSSDWRCRCCDGVRLLPFFASGPLIVHFVLCDRLTDWLTDWQTENWSVWMALKLQTPTVLNLNSDFRAGCIWSRYVNLDFFSIVTNRRRRWQSLLWFLIFLRISHACLVSCAFVCLCVYVGCTLCAINYI